MRLAEHKGRYVTSIAMTIRHHDLEILFNDEWWSQSGMIGFSPLSAAYVVDKSNVGNRGICLIAINDVAPAQRAPGVPVFKESLDEGITASERVSRILRGFVTGAAIPPVEMVRTLAGPYTYKLIDGLHRFYCSVAAGFAHIPAVKGFDFETLARPELRNDQDLC